VAGANDDGSPSDSLKILISAGNVVPDDWCVRFEDGDSDLIWGPEGSRFAIVRSISENRVRYEAYDLRSGRHLNDESWVAGKRSVKIKRRVEQWLATLAR
jgi:hypothetical protein